MTENEWNTPWLKKIDGEFNLEKSTQNPKNNTNSLRNCSLIPHMFSYEFFLANKCLESLGCFN